MTQDVTIDYNRMIINIFSPAIKYVNSYDNRVLGN